MGISQGQFVGIGTRMVHRIKVWERMFMMCPIACWDLELSCFPSTMALQKEECRRINGALDTLSSFFE
jgi:hypothetical protein